MKDGPEQRHFDAVLENEDGEAAVWQPGSAFLGILLIILRVQITLF